MSTNFGPKDFEETKLLVFPFAGELEAGATIATFAVDLSVLQGADPAAQAVKSGAATQSGTDVLQIVTGGVPGVVYHLRARAVDNTGLVHVVSGDLRIVTL